MENVLEQRMYNITSFYCQGLCSGIQSYHAGMEYAVKYWGTPEFQQWVTKDKTVIILAGGDSHVNGGSMEMMRDKLIENGIKIGVFHEPGMNDALTSISFLVDETVWDKITYPDTNRIYQDNTPEAIDVLRMFDMVLKYGVKTVFLRDFLKGYQLAK